MKNAKKDINGQLDDIDKKARCEANKTLLIWGGFGAVCALILWWLL